MQRTAAEGDQLQARIRQQLLYLLLGETTCRTSGKTWFGEAECTVSSKQLHILLAGRPNSGM
jgi:hypothetical protein